MTAAKQRSASERAEEISQKEKSRKDDQAIESIFITNM